MPGRKPSFRRRRRAFTIVVALASGACAGSASAQAPARPVAVAPPSAAAPTTTVRLIELLIGNGVLTRDQAQALLSQAAAEAAAARRAVPAARGGVAVAPVPVPVPEMPVAPGTVRIPYVSDGVREQIRADVRRDVLAQARAEGWALPGQTPEWTQRIRLFGDLRLRGEAVTFPSENAATIGFPNFAAINNAGGGLDLSRTDLTPALNVTDDRTRLRLRARLGVEAQIADWITGTVQLATGSDNSPVSTNQTFGQGSFFPKYQIWLDRGYMRFKPAEWLTIDAGRMPNPFFSTDLLYDLDLNFDGVAATARHRFRENLSGFVTAGIFPYFNSDFNFSNNSLQKTTSRDRYLSAVQGGVDWRFAQDWALRFGVGYYHFDRAEGALSAPCVATLSTDSCDTDQSRGFFTQNTNTFFPVRNIIRDPNAAGFPNEPQFQYFGLASQFQVLDINARLNMARFNPYVLTAEVNYLRNLAFDKGRITRRGVLSQGAANGIVNNVSDTGGFEGGGSGYMLRATFGHPDIDQPWHWNVSFAYRYLESDAVLDAFTDSDFRLGGTNSKGFILGGGVGIARNTSFRARWLSGEEVSGAPYRADVFQLDLLSRF